jgi:serine phosphatase RsbU (regulator of sigma subunit)/pSer/pThr/pTyr-binding forkhead associated (FHA) protein
MLILEIQPAQGDSFDFTVEKSPTFVGRSADCELTLSDRFLSRRHARIFRDGETWMIEDLGSRNGTDVDERKISEPTQLRDGNLIRLSGTLMIVRDPSTRMAVAEVEDVGAGAGRTGQKPAQAPADLGAHTVFRPAATILSDIQETATGSPTVAIDIYAERLRMVNEVHEALTNSVSVDELLELILDRVFAHLAPQNGAIFLKRNGAVTRAHSRTQPGVAEEFPESSSLIGEVVDKGLAALVADTESDARFAEAQSILASGVRSLVAAPLLTPDGAIGMIVLSSNLAYRVFSEEDMELLVSLASAAAMHIRNAGLAVEAAERQRLEKEVALARRIQSALLPSGMPEVLGLDLFGTNAPSQGVSGDYFQLVLHEETLAVLIADVSGKGIGASILTSYVDALCLAYIGEGHTPRGVFSRVSPQMNAKTPLDKFATALLAYVDPVTGGITYCSAGHDPGLIVRADGDTDWLDPTGIPLGLMPNVEYGSGEARLGDGDSLILYTDGIAEAINPGEEEYGRERLSKVCVEHRGESAADLAAAIERDVEAHAQGQPYHDDRTLVVVKRTE